MLAQWCVCVACGWAHAGIRLMVAADRGWRPKVNKLLIHLHKGALCRKWQPTRRVLVQKLCVHVCVFVCVRLCWQWKSLDLAFANPSFTNVHSQPQVQAKIVLRCYRFGLSLAKWRTHTMEQCLLIYCCFLSLDTSFKFWYFPGYIMLLPDNLMHSQISMVYSGAKTLVHFQKRISFKTSCLISQLGFGLEVII